MESVDSALPFGSHVLYEACDDTITMLFSHERLLELARAQFASWTGQPGGPVWGSHALHAQEVYPWMGQGRGIGLRPVSSTVLHPETWSIQYGLVCIQYCIRMEQLDLLNMPMTPPTMISANEAGRRPQARPQSTTY